MYVNDELENSVLEKPFKNYSPSYKHHIIFWVIYFVFNTLRWESVHNDFLYSLQTNLIGFPIHITLAYFNIYYLMPKFVYTRRYIAYTLAVLTSLFVMLLVKFGLTYYLVGPNVMPESAAVVDTITLNYAMVTMLGELYVVSFVTAIKVTIDRLGEKRKLHEVEKRRLTTELRFLRSQISPHFFFNTLNNIYSLTLEKSSKAPEVVLKLSELMRYLLYATKRSKQDLIREIDCIQNYIDLERIRFDDSLEIDISISGNMEQKKIAPMLLIPLIENCFKHGANQNIGKMSIEIVIKVEEDYLSFQVSNTIPENKGKSKISERAGGIGLSNVKKRLELGYDKGDYDLIILEKENSFHVDLKLKV